MSQPCPSCGRYQRTRRDGRVGCDNRVCPRGEPAAFARRRSRAELGNTVNHAAVAAAIARQRAAEVA